MKTHNPLIDDEKHYVTLNNYLKARFQKKTFKISLNGGFTCPNRDGTLSTKGCLYCSAKGSGDYAGDSNLPIQEQFYKVLSSMKTKWPDGYYIAYFQANTNTYGDLATLKKVYNQLFIDGKLIDENIKIISIATRPDCLDDEKIAYLQTLNKLVEVWIELGFQTSNENTAQFINRGYPNKVFIDTVKKLKAAKLTTIVHIINGLPGDCEKDMLDTVRLLNDLKIDGIKIHMLHIMKDTVLASIYQENPFELLSLEQYVNIVCQQLYLLNDNIVIHRLTGDAPKNLLIAPNWTLKKFVVLNEIDKKMRKENTFQGDLCIK